jgi:type IV secretion system protein TrbL
VSQALCAGTWDIGTIENAATIVLYAGLIFLGFGGCRLTSDMAINYYRTVLGVGVSLMTMQLIIGIGVQFLQDLVASTSQNLDAGQVGILTRQSSWR